MKSINCERRSLFPFHPSHPLSLCPAVPIPIVLSRTSEHSDHSLQCKWSASPRVSCLHGMGNGESKRHRISLVCHAIAAPRQLPSGYGQVRPGRPTDFHSASSGVQCFESVPPRSESDGSGSKALLERLLCSHIYGSNMNQRNHAWREECPGWGHGAGYIAKRTVWAVGRSRSAP